MRIDLRTDVDHKTNNDYLTMIVQFTDNDKHFYEKEKNWMPKTREVLALHQLFLALDPDYRKLILGE